MPQSRISSLPFPEGPTDLSGLQLFNYHGICMLHSFTHFLVLIFLCSGFIALGIRYLIKQIRRNQTDKNFQTQAEQKSCFSDWRGIHLHGY